MAEPVPPGDSEALARRIADLNSKFDAMNSANSSVKWTTRLVAVGVVAASVIGVIVLVGPVWRLYKNPKPLEAALHERYEERLAPAVSRAVDKIIETSGDDFIKLAEAEFAANQEQLLGAVDTERKAFVAEMQDWGTKEFTTRRDTMQANLVERLKKEIPDLQNEEEAELIMANAQRAMENAVNRVLTTHLSDHITAVNSIGNNLQTFPVPEHVSAMSDMELREELSQALGAYAILAFRGSLNQDTRAMLKELSAEPAGATTTDSQ